MRTYCIAQGTLLIALRWSKWEGNLKKNGYKQCMPVSRGCDRAKKQTLLDFSETNIWIPVYPETWHYKSTILQFLKKEKKGVNCHKISKMCWRCQHMDWRSSKTPRINTNKHYLSTCYSNCWKSKRKS